MTKYEPLGRYLREQHADSIAMTFDDIERLIGTRLPKSQLHRAWWSNNSSNSAMTKVWVDAGFRTEQVDMAARRLVFRRVRPPTANEKTPPPSNAASGAETAATKPIHPLFGLLKGLLRVMPGTDLTKPADPDWGRQ